MMTDALLWALLLLLGTLVLALPFSPALAALRQASATCLTAHPDQNTSPPGKDIGASLHLLQGTRFGRLKAGRIFMGKGPMPVPGNLPALERWQPPVSARPWGLKGWYIPHALDIPQGQRVPCALAVRGELKVRGPSLIESEIKAHHNLLLESDCHVNGNLFSEGDIRIGPGCAIRGVVMAEGCLHLSPGVVIGSPGQPVSVSADVIEVQGPVLIHGSVHAHIQGYVIQGPPGTPRTPANLHDKDKA